MPFSSNLQTKESLPSIVWVCLGAVAVMVVGFGLFALGQTSFLAAVFFLCFLFLMYRSSRQAGILCALAYLVLLGDIRRISALITGFPPNDPLVLVGPAFALLISLPLFLHLRLRDTPTKLALALMVVMVLQVANPGQGGGAAGLAGLIVLLPPLLWYLIGRNSGSNALVRAVVFKVIIPAALLACVIGLYQTFIGVPPWQEAWIDQKIAAHFDMIKVGNGIRAFGFSTASSEYTNLISMGCFFCLIGAILGRPILLLPLAILFPTLFLASSRGIIFRVVFAAAVAYAFKTNNSRLLAIRMALAVIVAFGGMYFALSQTGDYIAPQRGATAAQADLAHQVNGLAHPLDSKYSDAGSHVEEITRSIFVVLRHPIGFGTGTSNQGSKFAGDTPQIASEFDITDTFINLGVPGGVIYLLFLGFVIRDGYRYTRTGPKDFAVPLFAMMLSQIGAWFFNGEYGNGPLFFLMIGSAIRFVNEEKPKLAAVKSR